MVKRMLIDATHPEETRVVVLDGTRLDEFDVETSTKKQIKGNIYLAKVVRVEPSLQAAFVEYGGNRHGFLAFSEIHPDYYQIPVADRERLLADAERHHDEDDNERHRPRRSGRQNRNDQNHDEHAHEEHAHDDHGHDDHSHDDHSHDDHGHHDHDQPDHDHHTHEHGTADTHAAADHASHGAEHVEGGDTIPLAFIPPAISAPVSTEETEDEADAAPPPYSSSDNVIEVGAPAPDPQADVPTDESNVIEVSASETLVTQVGDSEQPHSEGEQTAEPKTSGVETVGGEDPDDDEDEDGQDNDKQRRRFVASRHYKIQEVIKRRQIMLVQVVKEERGNKGAALTTYLSLAGRYCVLMPNSARGGGVSRKITSAQDRRRLKEIVGDLELPKNVAVILRTAGAERSKAEIKRDYEYLQRTWNNIREATMQSRAPAQIHEEASLIKRSIRDIYSRDIEEVWVDGEEGYKTAKEFMRVLTPSHAKKVQRYKDDLIPLFQRYQVESQIETINSPSVQLRSGGSIVFGQTEALVAIDVNSGRATRERHIEETAYKTNMEAADEVARQLRLRDLAGLVVIDFIDMEDSRNNHAVERRLKEALRNDRARIQVGRISHFGLLELSRQRLRPSLIETNFSVCSHCAGTGLIRSTESAAVHTLRMLEEEGVKRRSSEVTVTVNPEVALYLLNYKREMLASVEMRYGMKIYVFGDAALIAPNLRLDRVKAVREDGAEILPPPRREIEAPPVAFVEEDEDDSETEEEDHAEAAAPQARGRDREARPSHGGDRPVEDGDGTKRRRKRRRRRRGGEFREDGAPQTGRPVPTSGDAQPLAADSSPRIEDTQGADVDGAPHTHADHGGEHGSETAEGGHDDQARRGRRRGRRGGRRRRRGGENGASGFEAHGEQGDKPNDMHGDNASSSEAPDSPFPRDPTHPAALETHLDPGAFSTPSDAGQSQTNDEATTGGRKVGFFRALKEGALGWRRNESQADEPARAEPVAQPAAPPTPRPEPVPEPVAVRPAPEPVVVSPPTPAPASPALSEPTRSEPAVSESVPSGPPRRGWWQQPKAE